MAVGAVLADDLRPRRPRLVAGHVRVIAPRVADAVLATERGLLPFGLGRQPARPAGDRAQPGAVRNRVEPADGDDRLQRQREPRITGHARQPVAGGFDEALVIAVGDRMHRERELVEPHVVHWPFVGLTIRTAHGEGSGRNGHQLERHGGHATWLATRPGVRRAPAGGMHGLRLWASRHGWACLAAAKEANALAAGNRRAGLAYVQTHAPAPNSGMCRHQEPSWKLNR